MAKKEKQTEKYDQIDELLEDKLFKGQHYGALSGDEIKNPKTFSTKSILFDYQISQNLPGERGMRRGTISRLSGPFQSGKTSVGLTLAASFQETLENPFVVVINAESRITLPQIKMCGVDISKERFRMINTNRAECCFDLTEKLLLDNPEGRQYFFLIDSSDALNRVSDLDTKSYGDAGKIAGGALMFSTACKRLALPIAATDSFLFITSQERANMNASPMGMNAGPRKTVSGGEALKFYPSWIGSCTAAWTDRFIFEDPSDKKSKVIGHNVDIKVEKNYDGVKKSSLTYPIKYNHGIWREREILSLCTMWNLIKMEGRTYTFVDSFRSDIKNFSIELPEKIVGQKEVNNFFDNNPAFTEAATHIFEKLLFTENRGSVRTINIEEQELTESIE